MNETTSEMQKLKDKIRDIWTAGDFGEIAKAQAAAAAEFVERLGLKPGMKVLDVACGSGNLAIPAARTGASVIGVDIAPNLIEQAEARAAAEGLPQGLNAKFEVGDAEAMRYADSEFDVVMTMFGAMFAPRPEVAAGELKRVCRSGGRIAMANWTPEGFFGQMFAAHARHAPPPAEMPSPLLWSDEETIRRRFGEGVTLQMTKRQIELKYPFSSPAEAIEHFRRYFGPTQNAFAALDEAGQSALHSDLTQFWKKNNHATDGTTAVTAEYLEVIAIRA